MNKLLKITRSTLLFLLLIILGLYFLIFSPIASSVLKPYIKKALEEKIGMPVDIKDFDLEYGTSSLDFSINNQADVSIKVSEYNLLNNSYDAIGKFNLEDNDIIFKGKFAVVNSRRGSIFKSPRTAR